jgi:hypothetical protein
MPFAHQPRHEVPMRDRSGAEHPPTRTARSHDSRHAPTIVLWQLRGTTDDLQAVAIETSFGYALGLELDHELVLLHLQPTLESLVAYADRIEAALRAQGWTVTEESSTGRSHHAPR